MIEEIRIRDLGVIGEAVLEPVPGFTAITGETGAGKTMLLSAVDLLLGGKADPALVRNGAERSQVEGRFYDVGEVATQRALDAGADLEDGALILGRTIVSAGYYLDLLDPAAYHYAIDPLDTSAAGLTPAEAQAGRRLHPLVRNEFGINVGVHFPQDTAAADIG